MASNRKTSREAKVESSGDPRLKASRSSSKAAGKPLAVSPAPLKTSHVASQTSASKRRDAASQEPARAVFETLGRWHEELTTAAEAMTASGSISADHGKAQFATLLASQKTMLEQVKRSLTEFQSLIDACEKQLASEAATAADRPNDEESSYGLDVPVQALQSFQQMALSNIGMWTKAAQDCQGVWLTAMHAWMPMPNVLQPFGGTAGEDTASEKPAKRRR